MELNPSGASGTFLHPAALCSGAKKPHPNITRGERTQELSFSARQQQLHRGASEERVEATWGQFYHLAAQTHTWHTCQRRLSQSADPVGLRGLPIEARQDRSGVLHGQLRRQEGGGEEWRERIADRMRRRIKCNGTGEMTKLVIRERRIWNKRNGGEESRWLKIQENRRREEGGYDRRSKKRTVNYSEIL